MDLFIVISIILLVICYIWYISIISRNNSVKENLSDIDVQLKKRTDLIPNILKIANKFMEHEKSLLTEITKLRSEIMKTSQNKDTQSLEKRFNLEKNLSDKMSNFMVAVENYPDLKSQENMIEAQRVYADVEEHISAARRGYNAAITSLRNAVQIFPGNIIAKFAGVSEIPTYFKISESDRKAVDANKYL